jgi:hypothetical protein
LIVALQNGEETWKNSTLEAVEKAMEAEGMENLSTTAKEEGSMCMLRLSYLLL